MLGCVQESFGQEEKITYINFNCKSKLHFLMENNVKEYVRQLTLKIVPKSFSKSKLGAWQSMVFTSGAGESHISFSWHSPSDGVSVTILVSMMRLGLYQDGNLITFCHISLKKWQKILISWTGRYYIFWKWRFCTRYAGC